MEKDFWSQESFISNVYGERLLGDGVDVLILFDPLAWVCVVLIKLFGYIRADVTPTFLQMKRVNLKSKNVVDFKQPAYSIGTLIFL